MIGMDFQRARDNHNNWHRDHKNSPVSEETADENYRRFLKGVQPVLVDAKKMGLNLFTTNPDSGLNGSVDYISLEESLRLGAHTGHDLPGQAVGAGQ